MRTIEVDDIAGTAVGGGDQRGGDFLPLKPFRGQNWAGRWQRLRRAADRLAALPPIDVVKYADKYWVLDGHNRVALALYTGQRDIDASVVELVRTGWTSDGAHRLPGRRGRGRPTDARPRRRRRSAAMIRRLTIDWPDPGAVRDPVAGARSGGWSCPTNATRPSNSRSTVTASVSSTRSSAAATSSPTTWASSADAFGVPVDYVRGNHDQGGRWARTVARDAPIELGSGRWHAIDGIPVVAFEWPGIRHRDRLRHDRTAWADVLRASRTLVSRPLRGRRGAAVVDQPRAAARGRGSCRRCVPRRLRRLSMVPGSHRAAALAARPRATGERRRLEAAPRPHDRRERDRRGPRRAAATAPPATT